MAMSWSRPTPLKVGERWYLTFGSGPTDYDGTSNQPGNLYVADLATGAMLRQFGPIESATSLGFFNDPVTFDKHLNYNVDAVYTTGTFLNGGTWQGGVYKIAIPCENCPWDSDFDPGSDLGYAQDPARWIYHKLMRVDTLTVTTGHHVLQGGSVLFNDFTELEDHIQEKYSGWSRQLEDNGTGPSERIVSKPAILGGMLLVPSFTPGQDLCGYGGMTNVLGVYYATGTGYFRQIFRIQTPETLTVDGNKENLGADKLPLGFSGSLPPMAGMQAGLEKGARALIQQSSGRIVELDVDPPFYFQRAIIDWWDD